MEVKRVMVGADFSPESDLAADQAIDVASLTGADIIFLHSTYPGESVEPAREELAALCARADLRGIDCSRMIASGIPENVLASAAEELAVDLVAVGTHGRTGLKRLMLGSVAERLIRLSSKSVLIARQSRSRGGFQRILVPSDFSPRAEEALRLALVLAARGGRIDVLHCWQVPALLAAHYVPVAAHDQSLGSLVDSMEESARSQGRALLGRHRRPGVELSFDSLESSPARGVRERAGDYDLIVVGSHGRRGARRLFLGSIAETTVRHAPCSVVVVHGE